MLIAAPIYMEQPHPVFVNGKPLGNAILIGGEPAIPVAALSRVVGGTVQVQGNKLTLTPPALQASASSDTFTLVNGGAGGNSQKKATGGGGAGKATFKEFTITKLSDKATPLLFHNSMPYVRVSDVAKLFGGMLAAGGTLRQGQSLNLTTGPNAVLTLTHTP